MGSVVIREYQPGDREAFGHVRSIVYRDGQPVQPEENLLPEDTIGYVAEEDGRIVGTTTAIEMTATKGSATLRCAGLAAVAVLPERRRAGIGAQMMRDILPMLKKRGFAMASLYPFRASYYRNFGYEFCGVRYKVSCAPPRMPKLPQSLEVRLLAKEDLGKIAPVYEQFARRYAGMNIRTELQWQRRSGDEATLIYVAGDPIEAYAVFRLNSNFWEKQVIKELVWTTRRGYEAMLGLFGSLGLNKTELEWNEPSDSPFFAAHLDQGTPIVPDRLIMYRVLDTQACLSALKSQTSGELSIEVLDDCMPENSGPWKVCFDPCGVHVERTDRASVTAKVGHFTQAYMGSPSFSVLVRNGLIEGVNGQDLVAGEALFPPQDVYCTDFF